MSMTYNFVDRISEFEEGDLSLSMTLELFADLISTGLAWGLQGSYGRTARSFIESGMITQYGKVTDYGREIAEAIDESL